MTNLQLRQLLRNKGLPVQHIKLSSGTIDPVYDFTQHSEVRGIICGLGDITIRPIYQRHPKLDRCDYYLCVNKTANGGEDMILFKSPNWSKIATSEDDADIKRWDDWK